MTRDEIIARIRANADLIKARGITHLALFGSRMRGDHRPDSDLDVLVEVDPNVEKFSLLDLAGVCNLIEDLTGLDTNAIERRGLRRNADFARRIADDVVEVF